MKTVITALIIFISINTSYPTVPTYSLVAKNFTLINANQLEFDMYLLWTNSGTSDPFYYASCQYCFTYNPLADDGQTWTVEKIASDLPSNLQPSGPTLNSATSQLRYAGNLPQGQTFQVSSVSPGTRILRTRISTNTTFQPVLLNLFWRNAGSGLTTKISYIDPNGFGVFITDTASHSVQGGNVCLNSCSQIPLISPLNNSTSNPTTTIFSWHKNQSAVNYALQIATDPLMNNIIVNDSLLTDTSRTIGGLLTDTKYYWWVKGKDSAKVSYISDIWNFTTIKFQISPQNNSYISTGDSIKFSWHSVPNASNYYLKVSTDSLLSNLFFADSTLTDTFKVLTNLPTQQIYYWRIIAFNNLNDINYISVLETSPVWNFSIEIFLLRPFNNSSNHPSTIDFHWRSIPTSFTYLLKVARDSLFTNIFYNDSTIIQTYKTITNFTNGKYYWMVSAKNNSGYFLTSQIWNFQVGSLPNPTYILTARNCSLEDTLGGNDNMLKFDITMQWTNQGISNPLNYASCQYCINFNPLIANGGSLSLNKINSELPPSLQPGLSVSGNELRYTANLPGVIFTVNNSFPGSLIMRSRLTTTASEFGFMSPNFKWKNTGSGLVVKISYLDPNGTGIFITDTANHLIDFQCNQALPVEIASFNSASLRNIVTLNWTTIHEINNARFEIERSISKNQKATDWTKAGSIEGNGTTSDEHNYSFEDRNLPPGKYNYRLKQIDFNGNFEYFNLNNEVSVGTPDKFNLSQNYPNPFNPTTKIDYDLPFDGKVSLILYDLSGREASTLLNEIKTAGYYSINFNGGNLASGVYFYRMEISGNNQKYTATKKMLLVK